MTMPRPSKGTELRQITGVFFICVHLRSFAAENFSAPLRLTYSPSAEPTADNA
jgi:hypothetical protein